MIRKKLPNCCETKPKDSLCCQVWFRGHELTQYQESIRNCRQQITEKLTLEQRALSTRYSVDNLHVRGHQ